MKKKTFTSLALLASFGWSVSFNINVLHAQNAISGGSAHSIVACEDGTTWICGDNQYGQLGKGTFGPVPDSILQQVPSLANVSMVSIGFGHSMALTNDGNVWTWGWNLYGQIGDSSGIQANSPVQIAINNVIQIEASVYNSMALKDDGTVWIWGDNISLQCPGNANTTVIYPTQITGLSNIESIAMAKDHNMVLHSDGTILTWGRNSYGQLGDGTTTDGSTPAQVPGLSNFKEVAAGESGLHSLALHNDGTVWAWGNNAYGQLGDGTTNNSATPKQIAGFSDIIAISAGMNNSMAIKNDGTVWAWGYNFAGLLGDGTFTDRYSPVMVQGLSKTARQIASGLLHSMAVLEDGTVWAWGFNEAGQLGNNETNSFSVSPVQMQLSCNVNTTVSTKELPAHNTALAIYPNPSSGRFTLELTIISDTEADIMLLNILGQKVLTLDNRKLVTGKNTIEIDMYGYPSGLYSLVLSSEKRVLSEKIIIE